MISGAARGLLAFSAALSLVFAGCDGKPAQTNAAPPAAQQHVALSVAAASSLKPALTDLISAYAAVEPGVTVTATYGASGNLYGQIANGAPFDVFLSADASYPNKLFDEGRALDDSRHTFARGRLVVWVPTASTLDLEHHGLKALSDPSIKHLAIANPEHAPYGKAAEAALTSAGLLDTLKERFVRGENVEQTAQFVQSGAADAAFLPLSLAQGPAMGSAGRHWVVPPATYPSIDHVCVIVKATGQPDAARALVEFVRGHDGREILKRHGFEVPVPPGGGD